jgi:hypothetical protein
MFVVQFHDLVDALKLAADLLPGPSAMIGCVTSRCALVSCWQARKPPRALRAAERSSCAAATTRSPHVTADARTGVGAGQDGCAARDLNPEPADQERRTVNWSAPGRHHAAVPS